MTPSTSATGRAKPARASRSPAALTSIWGWMRGEASPPSAASAARIALRKAGQAAGPGEGGKEQPVGPERAPDQQERARQVVDAVECSDRGDQVEPDVAEGQAVFIALHAPGSRREKSARIGGRDLEAAFAQRCGEVAGAAAKIERVREAPLHQVKPLDQLVGRSP